VNYHTNEEKAAKKQSEEKSQSSQLFPSGNMMKMMQACCQGGNEASNISRSMRQCCRPCMGAMRWFLLMILLFAGAALLLGYYLSPDSILVLWMIGWGIVLGFGIVGFITFRILYAKFRFRRWG